MCSGDSQEVLLPELLRLVWAAWDAVRLAHLMPHRRRLVIEKGGDIIDC